MSFRLKALKIDKLDLGCVECFYVIVDDSGKTVSPRSHFVCKASEFDVVAARFLNEWKTSSGSADVTAEGDAAKVLAEIRGKQDVTPAAAMPTALDQTISPPGPTKKAVSK